MTNKPKGLEGDQDKGGISQNGGSGILISGSVQKVADTLATEINQVPEKTLINLGEYQIISGEWLSKQPPLDGFFEEGQVLNPTPKDTNETMRQCWFDGDVYRYNELGSEWMLEQFGARVPSFDEIIEILNNTKGETNADKMKNIGVVATGWHDADVGRVGNAEFTYLRSHSQGRNGYMLAAVLHPDRSDAGNCWFRPWAGIVPFGVMDKKVSV